MEEPFVSKLAPRRARPPLDKHSRALLVTLQLVAFLCLRDTKTRPVFMLACSCLPAWLRRPAERPCPLPPPTA